MCSAFGLAFYHTLPSRAIFWLLMTILLKEARAKEVMAEGNGIRSERRLEGNRHFRLISLTFEPLVDT
jgi:hypothetical protein